MGVSLGDFNRDCIKLFTGFCKLYLFTSEILQILLLPPRGHHGLDRVDGEQYLLESSCHDTDRL